jgi:hypothetical protein
MSLYCVDYSKKDNAAEFRLWVPEADLGIAMVGKETGVRCGYYTFGDEWQRPDLFAKVGTNGEVHISS